MKLNKLNEKNNNKKYLTKEFVLIIWRALKFINNRVLIAESENDAS
jgi:hypothetical protein